MADADQRGAGVREQWMECGLVLRIEGARGFIPDRVARTVKQHASERKAPLFTQRQDLVEVELGVEAAEALGHLRQVDLLERTLELRVRKFTPTARVEQLATQ